MELIKGMRFLLFKGLERIRSILLIGLMINLIAFSACQEKENEMLNIEGTHQISEQLTVHPIEAGVYRVNHAFPWDANSLLLEVGNSELVLIDTPYTSEATQDLVEWLYSEVPDIAKLTVVNTGFHFDNLGGNAYLEQRGIEIIGTSKTVQMIRERGETSRQLFLDWLNKPQDKHYRDVYKDQVYVPPNTLITINEGEAYELKCGTETLQLYYPGESHSPDNITVYDPNKKVLFGGCMVKSLDSKNLGNTSDANLNAWPQSIEKLKEKYTSENVKHVIPGHGKAGDTQLLIHTSELFE